MIKKYKIISLLGTTRGNEELLSFGTWNLELGKEVRFFQKEIVN